MVHTAIEWSRTHWQWFLLAGWLLCQLLSKLPKVRANTDVELVLNFLKPALRRAPLVGMVADWFDTPEPKPAIQQPEGK